jgi:sugar lactone lactonase YvrE
MSQASRKFIVAGTIVAATAAYAWTGHAQAQAPAQPTGAAALPWVNMTPTNDLPSPYETIPDPFKLPDNRTWGATSAIDVDKDGKSIWVAERCGGNSACLANKVDPILHYDENGKLIKSFGAGKIVSPHGMFIDKDDNVWITDYQDDVAAGRAGARGAAPAGGAPGAAPGGRAGAAPPADAAAAAAAGAAAGGAGGRGGRRGGAPGGAAAGGAAPAAPAAGAAGAQAAAGAGRGRGTIPNPAATMGHQVIKFDKNGNELMRIGKAGGAALPECCYAPNDVIVAPDGSIFVSQGHGGGNNMLFKFDKTGKLIKTIGKDGSGNLEWDQPHSLAFDSKGRLFVADRANNRIQILDQDGKFLDVWYQFSRPSGIFIDKKDVLYSADSESGGINPAHGMWKRGIRIGSAKDGKVTAIIPDPLPTCAQGQQPGNPRTCATGTWVAEGVVADAKGNVYGAEVGPQRVEKYVPKKK